MKTSLFSKNGFIQGWAYLIFKFTSYTVFYIMGTLLCMQVPFVMFGALKSSEHFLSHGVFILLNMIILI